MSRDLDLAVRRVAGSPAERDDWDLRRPLYREGIECDYLTIDDAIGEHTCLPGQRLESRGPIEPGTGAE